MSINHVGLAPGTESGFHLQSLFQLTCGYLYDSKHGEESRERALQIP